MSITAQELMEQKQEIILRKPTIMEMGKIFRQVPEEDNTTSTAMETRPMSPKGS